MVQFTYTAACCQTSSFTKTTAFYAPNQPAHRLVRTVRLSDLFKDMKAAYVNLFPGEVKCTDDKHYVRLS